MDKEKLSKFVGLKIKEFRNARNMTQEDLAIMMGTTKQTIGRYENGSRRANQDQLFELSEIFKVNIDDFFPKADNPTVDIFSIYNQLNNERQKKVYDFADLQLKQQNGELEQNHILIAAHSKEDLTDDERQQINDFIDKIRKEKRK